MQESVKRAFQEYSRPIKTVTSFKYLGRVLTMADGDWPAVVGTLRKARKSWERLARIMGREGSNPRVSGVFFEAVVQELLLFGSDTWVMTPHMGRALVRFQHKVTRRITWRHPNRWEDGGWEYPPLVAEMKEAGFEERGSYILKKQNTVVQYIATRPILDLCKNMVRKPGAWIASIWWEQ